MRKSLAVLAMMPVAMTERTRGMLLEIAGGNAALAALFVLRDKLNLRR